MASPNVEARLTALEAEVHRLSTLVDKPKVRSWQKMVGAFANDPDFEEAMKYAQEYRESTRPRKRKPRKKTDGHS